MLCILFRWIEVHPSAETNRAKAPEAINLGAVMRRTEADMATVPCFGDAESCAIGDVCQLRSVLGEALRAFLAVLDRCTLADLVAPRRPPLCCSGSRQLVPPMPAPGRSCEEEMCRLNQRSLPNVSFPGRART